MFGKKRGSLNVSELSPVSKIIVYGILVIIALVWTIPTLGLLVTSIRIPDDASSSGWWTVFTGNAHLTLQNYVDVLGTGGGEASNTAATINLNQAIVNTIIMAVPSTVIPIFLAAIAVFGLAIFAPGIAAGLISGAPQLGAGAAVGTAAGLAAAGVAGAAGAGALARAGMSGAGRAVTSAASLSGAAQAGFKQGGVSGALQATIGQPAKDAAAKASTPMSDAYREGSAYGFRAAGGGAAPSPSSGGRPKGGASGEPDWAKRIRRHEQLSRAGSVASQSIREGDRGASNEGPDLDPNK